VNSQAEAGHKPSVAVLVDDLLEWVEAGLQLTGIQRVASELLSTALTRTDIAVWPGAFAEGPDDVRLVQVSPAKLRWSPPKTKDRLLDVARSIVVRIPLPRGIRGAAKAVYARLDGSATAHPAADPIDVLLVPGSFWIRDLPKKIARLAETGVSVRVVVYDLIPITNPEWFEPEFASNFRATFDALIPLCDRIVAISAATARSLIARYPAAEAVVRRAIPLPEAHAPRAYSGGTVEPTTYVPGRYILALGTVEPRKNHRAILDAWRLARRDERLRNSWLVIAGRRGWLMSEMEDEIARSAKELHLLRIADAPDHVIESLYAGCQATVHASWAEGFGLPARESVTRGIPTLLSTAIPPDGLPEDRIRVFDPGDSEALAQLMVDALVNPAPRLPIAVGSGTGWEPILSALLD
jgi:glycosyltransferase involved in cell wall biosynthesis